ncbi:adenosylhomocysteinase [Fretibacterium sp. OH1220_COT-178]|uniref:adenosylhomocysteinase n=1 Tax=Fretibacterium sp. OH1220_COT-178 TaxID=2491047 RepID=UPI000F603DBE|nr:adenosylhomocysteinase [Fretibacterium sp. OH1220_COT-178]RRD66245.1 adenosylhomocysteinase [Fretibacterium sp. OH1220_COT-178]
MEKYCVADIKLAEHGWKKIEWAWQYMPSLQFLYKKYKDVQPFKGATIAACLHLEAKTANLLLALSHLGATVAACGSNPLSTQDDICAALADKGVHVYSHRGMSSKEYFEYVRTVLSYKPNVIIDDGADVVATIHQEMPELIPGILGGSEETTSGVKRLRAMANEGVLKFPMIAVNDALSKYLFDNRYGTGQSVWDGFMRTTNMVVAGKTVVVVGYGWCGRGVAMRAAGLGAKVIVTEIDPHKACEALMDGFDVMGMEEASKVGDIFLTLTGNIHVIRKEHFALMKNGAVLGNAGHFDVEISKDDLAGLADRVEQLRENIDTYVMKDGRRLNLLGEGRLTNLACADGHPIEIMDLSFSLQLEAALHVYTHKMAPGLYAVPEETDRAVMESKLAALGITIDTMTPEQVEYMKSWQD